MMLMEILIVVAIISLVATGVAVGAIHEWRRAQVTTAKTNLVNLQQIADLHRQREGTCPTVGDLVRLRLLGAASKTTDPWGIEYRITCTEEETYVWSAGPDRREGGDDDLWLPERRPSS
jgi:type II secretory pathway pseudopilin PulG